jgi:hypothetical protein
VWTSSEEGLGTAEKVNEEIRPGNSEFRLGVRG